MKNYMSRRQYLAGLLRVIHVNVKRCNWAVSFEKPYGNFTLHKTQELLNELGLTSTDFKIIKYMSEYIAHKMESVDV